MACEARAPGREAEGLVDFAHSCVFGFAEKKNQ